MDGSPPRVPRASRDDYLAVAEDLLGTATVTTDLVALHPVSTYLGPPDPTGLTTFVVTSTRRHAKHQRDSTRR